MAALGLQSVAAVSRFFHGPACVSDRERAVKGALGGSDCRLGFGGLKGLHGGLKGVASSRRRSFSLSCARGSDDESSMRSGEDVDISGIVMDSTSDVDVSAMAKALRKSQVSSEPSARPPKFTTLRPFGEGGAGVMSNLEGSLFELLAANIQATADLKKFETLSGRMAMMAFFVAIGVEVVTGNSVFKGMDVKGLGQFAALSSLAALAAGGFAFAWRARSDVASSISKGALKLVDTAVDNVIDGLFYDEEEAFKE